MKHGDKAKLAIISQLSPAFITGIFKGTRRPTWETARDRLAPLTGTSPALWMEKNPAALIAAIDWQAVRDACKIERVK